MADSNTPIVLVVCNDYGELALAMYLLDRQAFSENITLMLPPRLHAKNPDVLPGRTFIYHSLDDIQKKMDSSTPGILGLFSGYLLPIHRLCDVEELGALLRSTKEQGWQFFTSDPFLGLLEKVKPEQLVTLKAPSWSLIWYIAAPAERRRLAHLLTEMHIALKEVLHVYPVGKSPTEYDLYYGRRLHFHNGAFVPQADDDPATQAPASAAKVPRWLFVLGDQDYTVQLGKHGRFSGKFRRILLGKLHETLEAGREPTLIAPEKVIEMVRKHSPAADSIELLAHCDYSHFQALLTDSEYVFYWNAVSFTCILRTLTGKPWFTFDDGHVLRGMNTDYASRLKEWFYQGDDAPRLDVNAALTIEALQKANEQYLKSAWRIRDGLLKTSDPQALLSTVSALSDKRAAVELKEALSDAEEMLQELGELVSANKLDGNFVVDTDLLPHPKEAMKKAATLLAEKGTEQHTAFASSAVLTLAFFQTGVGEGRHPIEALDPDGRPWKETVQADMLLITRGSQGPETQSPVSQAQEILRELVEIVAAHDLGAGFVLDTDLLGRPKSDITEAISLLVEKGSEEQAASASSAALTLAFFQSGVGEGRTPIDALDPDGRPWKERVQADMLLLKQGSAGSEAQSRVSEAQGILRELIEMVSTHDVGAGYVVDTDLLARPKSDIAKALSLLIAEGTEEQAASASSAALTLAFFQPGVGAVKQVLDSEGPGGKPWKAAVQAEMKTISIGLQK